MRALLKDNLLMKPVCMFDQNLDINAKIMYAIKGKYTEDHSKDLSINLAQVDPKQSVLMKYRFMTLSESGDLMPLFNPSESSFPESITVTYKGYANQGFEKCTNKQQVLTTTT